MHYTEGEGEFSVNIQTARSFSSPTVPATVLSRIAEDSDLGGLFAGQPSDSGVRATSKGQTIVRSVAKTQTIEKTLADAVALAKRWTSQIAMRIPSEVKQRIFRQLDRLHDPDEWVEGDKPLDLGSYQSFMRAFLGGIVGGKPGLALSQGGILIAVWQSGDCKLNIEFFPLDKVRYLASRNIEGEIERFSGSAKISSLKVALAPFENVDWFNGR